MKLNINLIIAILFGAFVWWCMVLVPIGFMLFLVATFMANLCLFIGWGIMAVNKKRRKYNFDVSGCYTISYLLLMVRNIAVIIDGNHHLSPFEIGLSFAIYTLQLYSTYKIIWDAWILEHK